MQTTLEVEAIASEKARILIIDDDEHIREAMSTLLMSHGYIVETAENGKQAIEKSQTGFYNLALIDIRLPDMYGTQLLTQMKETTPEMIKIIITGYAALENAIEAVNKGADCYLTKPVQVDELLTVIRDQLKKQQVQREYGEHKLADFIQTRAKEFDATQQEQNEPR